MNHTKWTDFRPNLDAAARERIQRERDEISLEMNLRELLQYVSELTRTDIAELRKVTQTALRRRDLLQNPGGSAHVFAPRSEVSTTEGSTKERR